MSIGLSEEQEKLRSELRACYANLLTPEVRGDLAREHETGPRTRESGSAVNEIQRDPIGTFGLGMPRTGRKA